MTSPHLGSRPGPHGAVVSLLTALILLALAGCVSVPTSGPVRSVGVGQQVPEAENVYSAPPPADNASPTAVVRGFLSAFAEDGADEHYARQFLTTEEAASWDPDGSVQLYSTEDPPVLQKDGAFFSYTYVGQLSSGGSYLSSPVSTLATWEPTLVKENDQWRISNPPNSVLLPIDRLQELYHQYFLYYFDTTYSVLVPYPIYLRYDDTYPLTPQALLSKLRSPDSSFKTARNLVVLDRTPGITLDASGIANVKVDFQNVPTNGLDRQRFAAQILYTLTQLRQIKGIQINGGGYEVPGSTSGSNNITTIDADAFPEYAPVRPDLADDLFGVTKDNGLVSLADGPNGQPVAVPVPEAPDLPVGDIDSIAVSAQEDQLAVVDRGRQRLTRYQLGGDSGNGVQATLTGQDLLPPQFTRFGEVWTVGTVRGVSTLLLLDEDGEPQRPSSTDLGAGEVTAFRISPDGTRIVVVRKTRNTYTLSTGYIDRSSSQVVGILGLTNLQFDPSLRLKSPLIDDVTWIDPTTLLVLADNAPYTVDVDGNDGNSFGQAALWEVNKISAGLTSDGTQPPAVAFDGTGQSWRLLNGVWSSYLDGLVFATFAG